MGVELSTRQGLDLWRSVLSASVISNAPDLTNRQMAILLIVYLDPPPHTVKSLAAELQVSKPVITRALDSMGRLGLIRRQRDEKDRRNVLVMRTVKGAVFLSEYAEIVIAAANLLDEE
jgi:DNA-binding MarR family transcriptional regulator